VVYSPRTSARIGVGNSKMRSKTGTKVPVVRRKPADNLRLSKFEREDIMKTWKKPSTKAVEAGFEVTRYMPAEIGTCKRK
jgi:hypothetical protein